MENIQNGLQEQNLSRAWNTAEVVIRCARIMRKPGNFHAAIDEVLEELAKTIQPDWR
ncbi:MAG: hypothetical protein K6G30_09820 [Acetatifactor sp.]|nr:hypothetical protein [Acetatifactor sp.]